MDTACLDHILTETERQSFEQNGYLTIENALTPDQLEESLRDFIGKDPLLPLAPTTRRSLCFSYYRPVYAHPEATPGHQLFGWLRLYLSQRRRRAAQKLD